ncbi:MAG: thioredoxin-disulfide reductase [Cenarchaeum symbiont of Oopsacas minuta]|nr:thioredoxin-disulfide reductase [Cenarchaeum symbiont of Oopsacas minuta]
MAESNGVSLVEHRDVPKISKKKTRYDVIIIGAGPAGYTAGIYCSRARYETLIISGVLPGGQLVNTTEVENYPGFAKGIMGPDLMIDMKAQAERMGTFIVDDEVVNVDFREKPFKVLTAEEEYEGRAVIICTGANPRKLGVKGEAELSGKGVSYCATCDGAFFRNQEILVVGGGDSAMEEATFLTKFASKVHVSHRRDKLRASKVMQEHAYDNPKIKFHLNTQVESINGESRVSNVVLKNSNGERETLNIGGVFVAIGHIPNTEMFVGQIDMDKQGYILQKDHTQTSITGIFTAGDVHDSRYRQAVTAAGFGCMAALDVDRYLEENP